MNKNRLRKILKGFFVCGAVTLGIIGLLYLAAIALFFVTGLLLAPLLSQMPSMV